MSNDATVFDLGDVSFETERATPTPTPTPMPTPARKLASVEQRSRTQARSASPATAGRAASSGSSKPWLVGLSLFVPGSSHLLRGEVSRGLAFLGATGFLAAMAWAVLSSLDRLGPTLEALGLSPASGLWVLAALFFAAAAVHVASAYAAAPTVWESAEAGPPHPLVAGVASSVIPGWGQAICGRRTSAALFLSGCWLLGGAWLLVSPPVQALLDAQRVYLPRGLEMLGSPLVLWTLPAVLWTLAVYDAAVRAAVRN